jgi:NADP-dependent 3-hydroxy acid dehydrogenase YdfG
MAIFSQIVVEEDSTSLQAHTGLLRGQFALVTGSGSGIGKAISHLLASEGATVALVGRTRAKLEITADGFPSSASAPLIVPAELSSDEELDNLRSQLECRFQQLDILVLCAGEIAHGSVASTPIEVFDKLYRTNVRANFRLVQSFLPLLKRAKKHPAQIVFINSSVGLCARPQASQYSATQHALKALADAVRAEVNADGIRVLSVYPGRVATPSQELLYKKQNIQYRPELLLQSEDIASIVLSALTLPRTAEVTDISIRPLCRSY